MLNYTYKLTLSANNARYTFTKQINIFSEYFYML